MPSRLLSLLAAAFATRAAAFDHVINIPPATSLAGLQSNTQVNVLDGANLSGFQIPGSLTGIEVNVLGGTIQQDAIVKGLNQFNIAGGLIRNAAGRAIHVTGGEVYVLEPTHQLTMAGGGVEFLFSRGSTLTSDISGGSIDNLRSREGSTTLVRGGRIGTLEALSDASTTLRGGEFRLNGVPVSGTVSIGASSILTGVLEDGSNFVFASASLNPYDDWLEDVQLVPVALPAAALVVDLTNAAVPNGLRPGQTLLASAGDDLGDNFHATGAVIELGAGMLGERAKMLDSRLTIDGGSVGKDLLIYPGSEIELRSGSIGSFRSALFNTPLPYGVTSSMKILGGVIGSDAAFENDPMIANRMGIEMEGGVILDELRLFESSLVQSGGTATVINLTESTYQISGGTAATVRVGADSSVAMQGGGVRRLEVNAGQAIVQGGRLGSLVGAAQLRGQFQVDGVPVSGSVTVPNEAVLSGVLTDGTTLALSSLLGDSLGTLNLVSAPVPPATPPVINAPFNAIPTGIRGGQVLTLAPGANAGHDFVAHNSTLHVAGGAVGDGAVVVGGTTLLSSGSIGGQFAAIDDAVVVVSGGSIGPSVGGSTNVTSILRGSSLTVAAGSIPGRVMVGADSSIDAIGGVINQVRPLGGSTVRVGGAAQVTGIVNTLTGTQFGTGRTSIAVDGGVIGAINVQRTDLAMTSGQADSVFLTDNSTASIGGGSIAFLTADEGTSVVMTGGEVTQSVVATSDLANEHSLVRLQGGLASSLVATGHGGRVEMDGGEVTREAVVNFGSMEIRGGRVSNLGASDLSSTPNLVTDLGVLRQTGGEIRAGVSVRGQNQGTEGAVYDVLGGVFGRRTQVTAGGKMRLHGGNFVLNGESVTGMVNPTGNFILTGMLSDGTAVVLSAATGDTFATGTLELVPAPVPPSLVFHNSPPLPPPRGLPPGQTLTLGDGVAIGYHFSAIGGTLNMTGGSIDYGMEMVDSLANFYGGTVGEGLFVHSGSTVNLAGGGVGDRAFVRDGAVMNLSAGRLGSYAQFESGSNFVMTGGAIGTETQVFGDAVISGGVVGRELNMQVGSSLELRGNEFSLNGASVSGTVTFTSGDILTGVLSDGTPVLFGVGDSLRTFTITETLIPEILRAPVISPASPTPHGVRRGQTVVLQSGATTGDDFTSLDGYLVVDGGQVASRLEAHNSRIELRDGVIGADATLYGVSTLEVRGGSVSAGLTVRSGSTLTQTGGEVGTLTLLPGAVLNVAGGDFQGQPTTSIGHDRWAPTGSAINLFGQSFTQNGVDLLAGVGLGESVVVTDRRLALEGVLADGSDFGLAPGGRGQSIGAATFTLTKLLLGDFNYDGVVNAADYTVWRDSEGLEVAAGAGADHDFDGVITATDREVWAANYGRSFAALASLSVPEPVSAGLAVLALVIGQAARQRSRNRV